MKEARLKSFPVFEGLSRRERKRVAQCVAEVDFDAGETLVNEGDCSYEFFVIETGTAEVTCSGRRLTELGPGDFLGEMGVLANAPRTATVIATSSMRASVMPGHEVREVYRELPEFAQRLAAAAKQRAEAFSRSSPPMTRRPGSGPRSRQRGASSTSLGWSHLQLCKLQVPEPGGAYRVITTRQVVDKRAHLRIED